jgi:hypothetical protein
MSTSKPKPQPDQSQVPMPFDLTQFIAMQQQTMQIMSSILAQYGLTLDLDRIDIEPLDCKDKCIDFVYRLKCENEVICFYLKEGIRKQFSQEEG